MITLRFDWHEVLWWMQGGMAGSHLRWSVYSDMVNHVWPQCTEEERRAMYHIMRRDLGHSWRPDGFLCSDPGVKGDGAWRPEEQIADTTPWTYFRQVLARFNPDNQYAVTMRTDRDGLLNALRQTPPGSVIGSSRPKSPGGKRGGQTARLTVRAYLWDGEYRIDWDRRCDSARITSVARLDPAALT